jgi:hypothetical protein
VEITGRDLREGSAAVPPEVGSVFQPNAYQLISAILNEDPHAVIHRSGEKECPNFARASRWQSLIGGEVGARAVGFNPT